MVAAVNFVVHDSVGGHLRGGVVGEGQGNIIPASSGDNIVLNVSRANIVAYEQQGKDLLITLSDGRVIVVSGYFDPAITDAQLYLSTDDQVTEVGLKGSGDGVMAADYGPVLNASTDRHAAHMAFSGSDEIVMAAATAVAEPATMGILAPALLAGSGGVGVGAAGLAGIGLAAAKGGSGGGNGSRIDPSVDGPDAASTLTTNSANPAISITGKGQPGDTVTVVLGDKSLVTTIGADGLWGVDFKGADLPTDGNHGSKITVTGPGLEAVTLDGPDFAIDMAAPAVSATHGVQSVSELENLAEYQDGVTISGVGEAGAAIVVKIDAATHSTTVDAAGNWTVTFTPAEVAGGERSTAVTVTATDAMGNVATVTDTLVLDTVPNAIAINAVTTDDVVTGAEKAAGFSISGPSVEGAVIRLEMGDVTRTVTAGAGGGWSMTFAPGEMPGGTYTARLTASTVDAAGNPSSAMRSFLVDTEVAVSVAPDPVSGDNIVNMRESQGDVIINGMTQPGASVSVNWGATTLPATVAADGAWTVAFPSCRIPADGPTTVTATATDAFGNTSAATRSMVVDTVATVAIDANQVGDDVIAGAEHRAGFSLTGTADARSSVVVTLEGVSKTVVADDAGKWSADYAPGEIRGGNYPSSISVTATDPAGNVATATRPIRMATETTVDIDAAQAGGDNIISGAERTAGVTLTGTAAPGASVEVVFEGTTRTVTATSAGIWSAAFSAAEIPVGSGTATASIKATDSFGNTATVSKVIQIDTDTHVAFAPAPVAGDNIINKAEAAGNIVLSGTSDPGTTVSVNWGGTDRAAVTSADGSWSLSYSGAQIPGQGNSTATVTATDPLGNSASSTRAILVDTEIWVAFDANLVTDSVVSGAERTAGFNIIGRGEPGASIAVTLEGISRTTTVGADGNWSVGYAPNAIRAGSYDTQVSVQTADLAGNIAVDTRQIRVDTETTASFNANQVGGDNIISAAERVQGITLTGKDEPNAKVAVTFEGTTHTVTAGTDGAWDVRFIATEFGAGTRDTVASVTTTDAFGNTATATHKLSLDTDIWVAFDANLVADSVVSGAERTAGFPIIGRGEPGASIVVGLEGLTRTTTVGADGNWSVSFGPNAIRAGSYDTQVSVRATDLAGNSALEQRQIRVDTETSASFSPNQAGGDNIISAAERLDGITLTGKDEPNATVAVKFEGVTRTVTASNTGEWSATFSTAEIGTGTRTSVATATATDIYGNTATGTHSVRIDTEVSMLSRQSLSAGADNVVNQAEAARGLTITGTVESGSTVTVKFADGATRSANVTGETWSIDIPTGDIPMGETRVPMVVTARDAVGNTRVMTETVEVDRIARDLAPATTRLSGDGYLNAAEAAQGLVVNGTAEAGSTVVVRVGDLSPVSVTAGANGQWSTTISKANLPHGEMETTVNVTAIDRAGNVASYSQALIIDTVAPGAPEIDGFTRSPQGLVRLQTDDLSQSDTFTRIDANGNISQINAVHHIDPMFGTPNVSFGSFNDAHQFVSTPVPDGSYLVVNTTDVAGNASSTLLVINNTNAPSVDLNRAGLSAFDFAAVDLTFAPDARLTITESQVLGMTGSDKTIMIKGGADDQVSILGGHDTGGIHHVDGEAYHIYTVGSSGATVLLDTDITVI